MLNMASQVCKPILPEAAAGASSSDASNKSGDVAAMPQQRGMRGSEYRGIEPGGALKSKASGMVLLQQNCEAAGHDVAAHKQMAVAPEVISAEVVRHLLETAELL